MISFAASIVIWSICLIFLAGNLVKTPGMLVPAMIMLLLGGAMLGTVFASLERIARR